MNMKLTLFAVIVALCLLSVRADINIDDSEDLMDLPTDLAEGNIEIEDLAIFSSTWWALRKTLRTVKGLNCLIKWVYDIQESILNYNAGVLDCGVTATQEVFAVVNANVAVMTTCNDILHLKTNVCGVTDDSNSTSSNIITKLSKSCSSKTLAKFWTLNNQVKKAISLTKKIPKTGVNASQCMVDQTTTLTNYYTQFPSYIKQCSKLRN